VKTSGSFYSLASPKHSTMKKIAFILFLIASMASCKKESKVCYKCIPYPGQTSLLTNDTIICEGHYFFSKAEQDRLTDLNAQEVPCKKMD
jgi:hypothetical protein